MPGAGRLGHNGAPQAPARLAKGSLMRFRLGCLVLMLVAAPGEASELPDYPFIFVTGHATQSVVPDVAKVSLTVRARNASSAAATETVGARSQQVLDLLLANQIASTDIDAHDVNKTTIFEPDSNGASGTARGPQVVRYDVSRSFTFLVHELGSWPQLGTKLLQMDNVEGIDCRFDRSDHKGIQSELTAAAAQDAKQHAESMCSASALPASSPRPWTTLKTPAGPPASMSAWLKS